VIRKFKKNTLKINNLYFDANSIIYDTVRTIDFTNLDDSEINCIIKNVFKKIDEYINLIEPNNLIYIGFDGTCPRAKLEQQRSRRYKSTYQTSISKTIFKDAKPDPFNTTAITPGTIFMNTLTVQLNKYYGEPKKYNVKNIILSSSDKFGEAEHKIFQFIRTNVDYHKEMKTVIYGLDADLIMLCIIL
jgi:5'-3' exoribonuclease 1